MSFNCLIFFFFHYFFWFHAKSIVEGEQQNLKTLSWQKCLSAKKYTNLFIFYASIINEWYIRKDQGYFLYFSHDRLVQKCVFTKYIRKDQDYN